MNSEKKFKVCVKCLTYNQSQYIEDTMNGFCMQETTFPFVCVIMDDASTDGESAVIQKYLKANFCILNDKKETDDYCFTFAQHKSNKHCFFAVFFLKYNHWEKKSKEPYAAEWFDKSKYFAMCEGDDYWTDSHKLQKQADVLDNNPDVYMVYTAFQTVDEKGIITHRARYDRYIKRSYTGNILPELFYANFILTLTIMLRMDVINSDLYKESPNKYDYTYFFTAAFFGKCYFISDVTGCYRKTKGSSITSRLDQVELGIYKLYLYFVDKFLNDKCSMKCSMSDVVKINRNMFINLFFHSNYTFIKRIIRKNCFSCLLIPEAFLFSILKKIKKYTYGSIDR